jgi:hypothetical protein
MSTRFPKRKQSPLVPAGEASESTDTVELFPAGNYDSTPQCVTNFDSPAATRPEHHGLDGSVAASATKSLTLSESDVTMDESARQIADDPMTGAVPYFDGSRRVTRDVHSHPPSPRCVPTTAGQRKLSQNVRLTIVERVGRALASRAAHAPPRLRLGTYGAALTRAPCGSRAASPVAWHLQRHAHALALRGSRTASPAARHLRVGAHARALRLTRRLACGAPTRLPCAAHALPRLCGRHLRRAALRRAPCGSRAASPVAGHLQRRAHALALCGTRTASPAARHLRRGAHARARRLTRRRDCGAPTRLPCAAHALPRLRLGTYGARRE